MAVLFETARTQVRSYLDEATAADWSNAELNRIINQRYHRVVTMVMTTFEDYYITTSRFNSVANKQEYTVSDGVPSDVFKIRMVELNYDVDNANGSPTRLLPLQSIDAVRGDLGMQNSSTGIKTYANGYYYTYGHGSNLTIGTMQIPDKNGTNAFKIWYVKTLPDLTDGEYFDIPYAERFYHIICEGSTADALRFGQQESEEADKYDAKFDRGLILMQEELEDKNADNYKMVMDVGGEVLDFT